MNEQSGDSSNKQIAENGGSGNAVSLGAVGSAHAADQGLSDAGVSMGIQKPAIVGFTLITVFFGVFGLWLALAPLDSAALAPGIVRVAPKPNKQAPSKKPI